MWKHIALFEWQYRRKRPATYLYFGILFLISFLFAATDAVEMFSGGQIKQNATSVIADITTMLSMISIFVISAIMGVSIVRDFEHRTEALFFTAPISKGNYLFGRFFGSMLVLFLVLTAIPLATMLAQYMPWRDTDKLLPFRASTSWNPFFVFVLPNAFFLGSLFFMTGALSRRMIVVFTQGMVVVLAFLFSAQLMSNLDNKEMVALLEPIGLSANGLASEYWSIAEKNHSLIAWDGIVLKNRLLWFGVAILCLVTTYIFFSFDQVRNSMVCKKKTNEENVILTFRGLPVVRPTYTRFQELKNILSMSFFYFRNTVRDLPFIALVFCGLAMSIVTAFQNEGMYGVKMLPTTYMILNDLDSFTGMFSFIIMVLYVGNLTWMERDNNFNLIHDAIPSRASSVLIGKYLGLTLSFIVAFGVAISIGLMLQLFMGGGDLIRLDVYIKSIYGESLIRLMIFMLIGFFIHVVVNNKFAGHAILIAFFLSFNLLRYWGFEHEMFRFNSGSLAIYSDMNGFGDSAFKFSWFKIYWGAFGLLLFTGAILLAVRGTENKLSSRWSLAKYSLVKPVVGMVAIMALIFVSSGAYIYYNTNVINEYKNSKQTEKEQVQYEITLKKFENKLQPKITEVSLNVDLQPETRSFFASGFYTLKNKTDSTINDVHVLLREDIELKSIKFDVGAKENQQYVKEFGYYIYHLDKPLIPGDSVRMNFEFDYVIKGFTNGQSDPSVVFNGTFISNSYFPHIGYSEDYELSSDDKRKEHGLKPRERMKLQTDAVAVKSNTISTDADLIRFEATVSTANDQIAIAPGYLQKKWLAKDKNGTERQFFKYQMDTPMLNFYTVVSARYLVKKEIYKGVNLEVYYHPGHDQNLDRMMLGMKASLDYYQDNYGPYQSRQLRIMEFPRYRGYAQSFANTVPFSESMGFIVNVDDKKDVDLPFYVTAHEVAHQWWAHQVSEAGVQGGTMLSESLAEYSAQMVMGKVYSKEKMQKFLEYELNEYLRGRSNEQKKEQPVNKVEGQQYIHYYKGAHVLYALQDQIGESTLNNAFKSYLQKWNVGNLEKNGRYPITSDLITEIRKVTPDSLQYLVTDLLETITLFDNKADKVTVKQQGKQYAVTLDYSAQKLRADSLGNETPVKLNDWVWIGVFGKDGDKKEDKLLYYQRYKINKEKGSVTVMVKGKPTKAGIDPLNLLIDRHVKDNVKVVE
jgi:ABC-2 type transport system permease protein